MVHIFESLITNISLVLDGEYESVNKLINNLKYWQEDKFKEYFSTKQK